MPTYKYPQTFDKALSRVEQKYFDSFFCETKEINNDAKCLVYANHYCANNKYLQELYMKLLEEMRKALNNPTYVL